MSNDRQEAAKKTVAIVVHPFTNPQMQSVFQVPMYAIPADDCLAPQLIDWEQRCAQAINGSPLRIEVEGSEGRILLVPLSRDVFVSIQSWEAFQQQVEKQHRAARLLLPTPAR